jgi:hypothetical protein
LYVTGEVEYPSGGLTASLVKANPQGTNPAILILDVEDTKTGDADPVITQAVTCEVHVPLVVNQVTVRSAAPDFTIDVST